MVVVIVHVHVYIHCVYGIHYSLLYQYSTSLFSHPSHVLQVIGYLQFVLVTRIHSHLTMQVCVHVYLLPVPAFHILYAWICKLPWCLRTPAVYIHMCKYSTGHENFTFQNTV